MLLVALRVAGAVVADRLAMPLLAAAMTRVSRRALRASMAA